MPIDNPQKRPTKKQHELLSFIEKFIAEHGYGPSYREIMRGCDYTSPATVALHINNLVARGHLRKKGRSARSIEVVDVAPSKSIPSNQVSPAEEKWLVQQIDWQFSKVENGRPTKDQVDQLYILVGALKILGLIGAANSFIERLNVLKNKID